METRKALSTSRLKHSFSHAPTDVLFHPKTSLLDPTAQTTTSSSEPASLPASLSLLRRLSLGFPEAASACLIPNVHGVVLL